MPSWAAPSPVPRPPPSDASVCGEFFLARQTDSSGGSGVRAGLHRPTRHCMCAERKAYTMVAVAIPNPQAGLL